MSITYLNGWTERDDVETPLKGWRDDVVVQLSDRSRIRLSFWDPERLKQTVNDVGRLTERNLIVVDRVSRPVIEELLRELHSKGLLRDLYKTE